MTTPRKKSLYILSPKPSTLAETYSRHPNTFLRRSLLSPTRSQVAREESSYNMLIRTDSDEADSKVSSNSFRHMTHMNELLGKGEQEHNQRSTLWKFAETIVEDKLPSLYTIDFARRGSQGPNKTFWEMDEAISKEFIELREETAYESINKLDDDKPLLEMRKAVLRIKA